MLLHGLRGFVEVVEHFRPYRSDVRNHRLGLRIDLQHCAAAWASQIESVFLGHGQIINQVRVCGTGERESNPAVASLNEQPGFGVFGDPLVQGLHAHDAWSTGTLFSCPSKQSFLMWATRCFSPIATRCCIPYTRVRSSLPNSCCKRLSGRQSRSLTLWLRAILRLTTASGGCSIRVCYGSSAFPTKARAKIWWREPKCPPIGVIFGPVRAK